MASSKRPSQNTNPDPTVMIGGDSDEDLVSTSAKKLRHDDVAADEPMNDGATAFVRVDQVPQDNGYNDGAGDTVRNPPPAAEDDAAGATAFVRLDHGGPPAAPIPSRPGAQPKGGSAPKRGLQVQLPDDEPPPAPKPKPKPAPAPAGKKGRRGAWWDEEAAKVPDEPEPQAPPELPPEPEPDPEHDGATAMYQTGGESEDDAQGATAFVPGNRNRARQAEPEPEIEAPKRKKVEEPEVYRPVAADDYEGHLGSGPPKWKVWLRRAVVLAIVFTVLGAGALIGGYVYIVRKIPPFESVRDYKPMVATQVIADDGTVIGQFYKEKRTVVKMEQIPRVLVNAVLSAEDKDFYKHGGVNPIAMARAVVTDVLSGRRRVGASTITQQVVKNFF
ncbi:MAG: transglycosylase domain-containing protein, partial [Deltaproteobacteria bacterium]|nr:transglycosylase domain-containing protein [Deltaproteobacteria bacterium]